MNLDTRLEVPSSVVTREIGGEMVLMDLESGTYFGLDAIGGRAWQAFEEGLTIKELCARFEHDFEVAPEQLREDMLTLARKLLENNLVSEKQD
jgi:hypothetical protein